MVEKDKYVNSLTDQIINNDSGNHKHNKLLSIIKKIHVSPEVEAMGEEMRESIWQEVNSRIESVSRRSFWLKATGIAASILILLGLTNYFSYQEGYKQLNSQLIELNNPLGIQSSITLSDGTKVTLNAGSTLTYPTAFVTKNREVKIDGEAFFEVAKDADHPFIVSTENINIRVLGTKFNIKAYNNENNIDVTLEEGSVEVGLNGKKKYHRIEPGQQIRFDKSELTFIKRNVNLTLYTSWKEGKFYFHQKSFEEIAKQLERKFNVDIYIASDKLKHIVYTGDFVRNENLEQILKVMTADKRSKYNIDGDQVQIYE